MSYKHKTLLYVVLFYGALAMLGFTAHIIQDMNNYYHELKRASTAHVQYGTGIIRRECFFVHSEMYGASKPKKKCLLVMEW